MPWWAWVMELYLLSGLWLVERGVDNCGRAHEDTPEWASAVAVLAVMLVWPWVVWAAIRSS